MIFEITKDNQGDIAFKVDDEWYLTGRQAISRGDLISHVKGIILTSPINCSDTQYYGLLNAEIIEEVEIKPNTIYLLEGICYGM